MIEVKEGRRYMIRRGDIGVACKNRYLPQVFTLNLEGDAPLCWVRCDGLNHFGIKDFDVIKEVEVSEQDIQSIL